MIRVGRFMTSYLRHPDPGVREEEITISAGDRELSATLLRPRRGGVFRGWILLHGITVPGRKHAMLVRFARSVAGAGGVVLIPEVESWRRLRIDPGAADPVVLAAAAALEERDDVTKGGAALVGFSFGATQAIVTATNPLIAPKLRSVVAFGGYCDLRLTLRFMMTGEHEWAGAAYRLAPDPYGRWIVAANYLTRARGYGNTERVAAAAEAMAAESGRIGKYAGDPVYDPMKALLRESLSGSERELWDVLAPPSGREPPREAALELAEALVGAALEVHPHLDPRPALPTFQGRLVLAHGFLDHLIPFSESLRLRDSLPPSARVQTFVTRLFAHSTEARLPFAGYPAEIARYCRLLREALR